MGPWSSGYDDSLTLSRSPVQIWAGPSGLWSSGKIQGSGPCDPGSNPGSLIKMDKLAKQYKSNKPFPHIAIKDFFDESLLESVLKALLSEKFSEQEADLFAFQQTNDLKLTKNKVLKKFRAYLLSAEFVKKL